MPTQVDKLPSSTLYLHFLLDFKLNVAHAHCIVSCQLKKMEESHQEATEKEVERILGYLKSYQEDDREFLNQLFL